MALDGRSVTVCHKSALSPVYEPVITDSNWNDGHFTHFHFIYCSKFGKFTDDGVTLVPNCGKVMLLSTQHRTSTVTSVDEEAGDYYVYSSTKQRAASTMDKLVRTYSCKRASFTSSKRLTCHHQILRHRQTALALTRVSEEERAEDDERMRHVWNASLQWARTSVFR